MPPRPSPPPPPLPLSPLRLLLFLLRHRQHRPLGDLPPVVAPSPHLALLLLAARDEDARDPGQEEDGGVEVPGRVLVRPGVLSPAALAEVDVEAAEEVEEDAGAEVQDERHDGEEGGAEGQLVAEVRTRRVVQVHRLRVAEGQDAAVDDHAQVELQLQQGPGHREEEAEGGQGEVARAAEDEVERDAQLAGIALAGGGEEGARDDGGDGADEVKHEEGNVVPRYLGIVLGTAEFCHLSFWPTYTTAHFPQKIFELNLCLIPVIVSN